LRCVGIGEIQHKRDDGIRHYTSGGNMGHLIRISIYILLAAMLVACTSSSGRAPTPPLGEEDRATQPTKGDIPDAPAEDVEAPTPDVGWNLDIVEDVEPPPEDTIHPPEDTIAPPSDTIHPPEDVLVPETIVPLCCGNNAPCPDGMICAGMDGAGVCYPPAEGDACWSDEECPEGTACVGESVCPCNALCVVQDEPGLCTPTPSECCLDDDDCDEGMACYGLDQGEDFGVCKPPAPEGACWGDVDCGEGFTCQGASFCPCGYDCMMADMPGTCVADPLPGCCQSDDDCDEGLHCYISPLDDAMGGVCKEPPAWGSCWGEEDCTEYGVCQGASMCPCGAICGMLEAPGTCEPKFDGCCNDDGDCAADTICAIPPGMLFGGCSPSHEGQLCDGFPCCYMDEHCGEGEFCKGAEFCGCLGPWDGYCQETVMGQCKPL
jgi:hypothetical protein